MIRCITIHSTICIEKMYCLFDQMIFSFRKQTVRLGCLFKRMRIIWERKEVDGVFDLVVFQDGGGEFCRICWDALCVRQDI